MSHHVPVNAAGDLAIEATGTRALWFSEPGSYRGIIDDFRMLPTVPSEDEAIANARRELDGDEAALTLCYLQFGEGTGTSALDSSGNARNATLSGTARWVGFEGTPDLAGTRKPLVWGVKRMRKGVLVDSQRVVFQVNAGNTHAIVPLENGLASLTYDGDLADIYDWTPVAGHYATQLSRGLVRLNDLPDSNSITLSFDVWGDVDPDNGYTEVTAEIMRNVAVRKAGLNAVEGIDTAAVASVAADRPDSVGFATGSSSVTIMTVLNDLAGGVDGWWTMLTDGRFSPGLRAEPGVPEFELGVNDIAAETLECIASSLTVRQWTLSYGDQEVTVPPDKVAGAIPATQRSRFTKSLLYASSPDLGPDFVKIHKEAIFATGATLYDTVGACRRECQRRAALDKIPRSVYKAVLPRGVFQYRVGQPGRIVFPRYGMDAGWPNVVGGFEMATETNVVTLFVWGVKIQ
jgi:hypothetical protein